jgi:DNA-binding response OmpR family regulator
MADDKVEILIVEDSPTQALQLQRILEKYNYHVAIVSNGKEALDRISNHEPMMVISDVIMPDMDGYELCRLMKENEKFEDIPIILLTKLSDRENIIKGLGLGADNFITKPYKEDVLISRVRYLLANFDMKKKTATEKQEVRRTKVKFLADVSIKFLNTPYKITNRIMLWWFKSLMKGDD